MVKLVNILNEVLNEFSVQAAIFTSPDFNITDILDQIRALRKVTIVRNITPEDYIQKPNIEYHLITIKFMQLFTYLGFLMIRQLCWIQY